MHDPEEYEQAEQALREMLQFGIDQLDRGERIPFTPELMAQIRQEAIDRFHRVETPNPDVVP
jgi:hypothetical protein